MGPLFCKYHFHSYVEFIIIDTLITLTFTLTQTCICIYVLGLNAVESRETNKSIVIIIVFTDTHSDM
jgi:hypothetical protein